MARMRVPLNVRASSFAHHSQHIRRRSLRHRALVNATYNRHFSSLGTYEMLAARWYLHQFWMTMAASASAPAGSATLARPQPQCDAS